MGHPEDFNQPGKASVLFGGSFGSEGKGLAAAYVALHSEPEVATTNAAPNAGHTTILEDGTKFVTFHLPTAGVICKDATIYLNAGAIINPEILHRECEACGVDPARIVIHPRAAVVEQVDIDYEANPGSSTTKLGSTRKGGGRALARKIMREGTLADDHPGLKQYRRQILDLNSLMTHAGTSVMVEVPQGYHLGINSGLEYPTCTSRDISVMQGLADAGIHPSFLGNTMAVIRIYEIRVGHIVESGLKLGDSGGCYPDQHEITFESIGQEPEFTTVTKRQRRVFTFSLQGFRRMVTQNRPTHLFANFVNYFRSKDEAEKFFLDLNGILKDVRLGTTMFYGTGPNVMDVIPHKYGGVKTMSDKLWGVK